MILQEHRGMEGREKQNMPLLQLQERLDRHRGKEKGGEMTQTTVVTTADSGVEHR